MRAISKTCHPADGLSLDSADVNYSTRNITRVSYQICILHSYWVSPLLAGLSDPKHPQSQGETGACGILQEWEER